MSYGNPFGAPPPSGGLGPPPSGYGPPPDGPLNPYRAPGAGPTSPVGAAPPGSAMKWLFLAGNAGYWLFAFTGVFLMAQLADGAHPPSGGSPADHPAIDAAAQMATGLPALGVLLLLAGWIGAGVWLYKAWGSVPEAMRFTDAGRWITPGQAVGYMFIPFYNFYWVFVANLGLCEAVNRTLLAHGAQPRAPRGLAVAACVVHLIPYCNLLVGPILWTTYFFMVDSARREMLQQGR
jgi:hypothetical protein